MLLSPTTSLLQVWPRRAHRARRHPRALAPTSGRAALDAFRRRRTVQLCGRIPRDLSFSCTVGIHVLRVRERSHYSGIRCSTLSCAGHTAGCLNVRPCWCVRVRRTAYFAFRVLGHVAFNLFSRLLVTLPVGSGVAHSLCSTSLVRAAGLARCYGCMLHDIPSGPMVMQLGTSLRSELILIMTAGSVLRPTSSSASIDAILNAFVATRSRSGHPRLRLVRIILIYLLIFYLAVWSR
ncbi:hypothetical protein A0H81_12514 [Grifola frondosa]|uniref:Uncharacterized protein n=1 Tax=Grifola frondosa TaxID=5627 RepID=A0A1C7LRT6_GRIFR|nr:hypothetical protein A0H81_12514 [Grifola frondosa]